MCESVSLRRKQARDLARTAGAIHSNLCFWSAYLFLQEATHAALQSSVESMTMDNLSVQTHVGELSKQLSLSLQHTSAPAAQEEGGKQQQMWGDVQVWSSSL